MSINFNIPKKTDQFDMDKFVVQNWKTAAGLLAKSMTCRGKECSTESETKKVIPDMNKAAINTIIGVDDGLQVIENIPPTSATRGTILTFNANTDFTNYYNTTTQFCCTSENELFYRSCWDNGNSEQWSEWVLINNDSGELKEQVEQNTSDISEISTQVEQNTSDITDLEDDMSDYQKRINTAEIGINSIKTRLTNAENNIESAKTRIDTAESDIKTLDEELVLVDAKSESNRAGLVRLENKFRKNLYVQKTAIPDAYVQSNGNINDHDAGYANQGYYATDYILVSDLDAIYVSSLRQYAFYDSDKIFISSAAMPHRSSGKGIINVPENAHYLRITVNEEVDGTFVICDAKSTSYKKVAFIGDSITYGYDGSKQVEKPYPAIIKNEYGFAECYSNGVVGRTLGGTNAGAIVSRIDDIIDQCSDADVFVIFAGTNDYGNDNSYTPVGTLGDTTIDTFYGSLETLWSTLIPKVLGKKLFFVTSLHRISEIKGRGTENERRLPDYVNAAREVCEKYGVDVIDLYKNGEFFATLESFRNKYSSDGLHPNQDWYYILARKIGDYIVNHMN